MPARLMEGDIDGYRLRTRYQAAGQERPPYRAIARTETLALDRQPAPTALPRLHLQLEGWAKTFGDLYRLKLANQEVVVMSNPESIAGVMRARPDTWSRPRNFAAIVRETGGQGLFAAEGDDWRRQRRMVMTGFDPTHLRNYMPSLLRVTERLRQRWIRAARAGTIMDLQAELMRYSVDAASGLSFGVDINTLDDSRSELHEHMKPMFPTLFRRMNMPFPYWKYYRLPSDVSHDEHLQDMHRIIAELVAQGRERLRQHPERREQPTDLLEAMLAARDADGSALSEETISGNVFTMLLASEDTTANTLAWTLYLLHRNPAAWQRLVAEADAVLQRECLRARYRAGSVAALCRGVRQRGHAPEAGRAFDLPGRHPGDSNPGCSHSCGHASVHADAPGRHGRKCRRSRRRIPA